MSAKGYYENGLFLMAVDAKEHRQMADKVIGKKVKTENLYITLKIRRLPPQTFPATQHGGSGAPPFSV